MVNIVTCYRKMLHKVMKLAGMKSIEVEIDHETKIHFWVPSKPKNSNPNIVLLHGFAGDGILTWQFQVLTLRKKYNVYVPDFLFFGKSYTSKFERSAKFQANCLAFGLKSLGLEKCIVVGFSYGGMVSFQLAEHHPELVGSVIITDSVLGLTESISRKGLAQIGFTSWADFLIPNTSEGVKVLLDYSSYKNNFPWFPRFVYQHYLEVMFNNRKERFELLDALVIKDEDVVTNHQFQQVIHLIWGNQDKIFDMEVANNLKERLGGKTRLLIVEDAGHLAMLERPSIFNRRLKEILDSLLSGQFKNM
ncbi:hypothetical protein RND81_14G252000 [Saponaria officinalis]|uniref:AB hydrolase-1 domain-containing protein n=1 Tax=Saponaria officinalis TaxID=3572 RepID=A0AAW1GRA3_SAPOF